MQSRRQATSRTVTASAMGILERLNTADAGGAGVGQGSLIKVNDQYYDSSDDDLNGGRSIIQEIDYQDKNRAG